MGKGKNTNRGEKCKRNDQGSAGESSTWSKTKCSKSNLLRLVDEGLLQGEYDIHWRLAGAESFTSERDMEIVLFTSFIERSLALPACDFL